MDDACPVAESPSKPPRRFLRTRIAVSVFFGAVTVALCVLSPEPSIDWAYPPLIRPRGPQRFYALLVSLTLLMASVPWIGYRFSLRTMLIATTLVAVVLGLVCYNVR